MVCTVQSNGPVVYAGLDPLWAWCLWSARTTSTASIITVSSYHIFTYNNSTLYLYDVAPLSGKSISVSW